MTSFMSTFLPGGRDRDEPPPPPPPPPLSSNGPHTPKSSVDINISSFNSFINPASTPKGSPSKKTVPPGAHDLPAYFESAMSLGNGAGIDAPVRLTRPQSLVAPLSPGKTTTNTTSSHKINKNHSSNSNSNSNSNTTSITTSNINLAALDSNDELPQPEDTGSVVHKNPAPAPATAPNPAVPAPSNPRKQQHHHGHGQENTPPASRLAGHSHSHSHGQGHGHGHDHLPLSAHNHAALSRQQMYEPRDRPLTSTKRFNTNRGLTLEERQILDRPNVRRMVNVTQLYFLDYYFDLLTYVGARQKRLAAFKAEFPAPTSGEDDHDKNDHDNDKDNDKHEKHRQMWAKYAGRERAGLRKRRVRLRQGDFQILTQVGQGGYGQVFLAQKKDTREVCALKVMSKKLLFKLDEVRHVLTERDILTTAHSDWLVRLLYSFQDDKNIYLAMEYVPGGDFRTLLNNTGVLSNRHARFYIAEMFCAVNALHKLGYIHRDLKPENFLVDSTGHVKLTDFGLAAGVLAPSKFESMRLKLEQASETRVPFGKPIGQRTVAERRENYRTMRENDVNYAKSIVGSPDYMAPEVLRGEEYDFTVDYWSLGCMLFEALTGFPPFAGATPDETWRNLKHWKEVLKRPVWEDPNYFLSNRTWNFLTTCINSRSRRFSNIKDICAHQYFSEVDWETLRQTRAPFVPELDSETDAGYFDDFGNENDMAKYKEVHEKQAALESMAEREEEMSKSLFVGFTFRHRKPAADEDGSPRKRIPTDEAFGTML